ncbi:MAG: DUF2062 domain-containing protein [Alphaproteobacteria bacterium]
MFKRRNKPGLYQRARNFFWPHTGWQRAAAYIYYRLLRLPGTPHTIAAGFACGAAVSFTPFVGFHFVLASLLGLITGGNVIAALIGTVVGNPWTFPFIWLGTYRLGSMILGWDPTASLSDGLTLTYLLEHPILVLVPMVIGGVPAGAVAWVGSYWPVRRVVQEYQELRRRRRIRRRAKGGRRRDKLSSHRPPGIKEDSA